MEELASMRFKVLNPMIKTYIDQERKFFGTCFNLINKFYNNMDSLQQPIPYIKSNYDAMKYTRAAKIMEGVDTKNLPEIKMKDKYSYDNYKNNLQRANSCVNNNNVSNNFNNNFGNNNKNEIINKKFSYEDYKMRKSSIDNSIRTNNNNINSNNISTSISINNNNNNNDDNKKDENKNNNPYSYEAYKRRTQSLGNNKRPQINNTSNNNNNYYNNNLNLVMNSILGDENKKASNPFMDINKDSSLNNPYNASNNNPYNNIFNSSSNNNTNNTFNSMLGNKGNNQNNNNDNNRFRRSNDKYNFGF